jgi:chromosome segregation ATPase
LEENVMAAMSLAAWERFYERVVARGGNWPRALWFAAVEDGLAGALPENSRLLAEYRRHVAEWTQLEAEAAGSHRDAQRVAQLEGDIMRLIGRANQTIRERAAEPPRQIRRVGHAAEPVRERSGAWLSAVTIGVMLFCGALLGATYYQNHRMMQRMNGELVALHQQLTEQAADERAALELRIRSVERVRQDLDAAQAELRGNVAQFNEVMSASVRSITALGDSALGDLARRLAAEDGEIEVALNGLRARATTLERGLDEAAESLSALTLRVPDLGSDVDRLAAQLKTTEADFERITGQVQTIEAQAPELALWLEGQRQGLAQTLDAQRQSMDEVGFEIASLKGALNESRGELLTFQETIQADLTRAKQQEGELTQALDHVRASELQATEVVAQITARAESTQSELQGQIDAILSDLAETADLAILRSEDAMKAAQAEGTRRLEAAAEQAIASLTEAREQRLAELGQWAAAAQSGLAQTEAGLVAGWRGMSQAVAERHSSVLAELDRYAATLEGRVKELLDALDVIVVRSNG